MKPDQRETWLQADRIFNEMLDLSPQQRATRLAALEPGSALRQRVERLLAADDSADGLLEQPVSANVLPQARDALTGRLLGRWRLQQAIGRGGMAVVYRAVAEDGATGQVAALKVLTLGSLAHDGCERFLREQQALLRLRHPYIATLYDAGLAEDGTPWLAMALVDGERIDRWCEHHQLDIQARVQLALQVCEALAYAHRNLVIHRDIKPSNVLVDEDGHVRLLDFGIARLADAVDDEATATWLRALTPEYAAPEQFAGAPPSTAMDVYGLGALLYCLLAGVAPRRGDDTTTPLLAPSRATQARDQARQLRGDLDTVLLKALAEQPEQRYPSVEALADDLRRWLQQRPVRAHPPSLRYRSGKYVARHRMGVMAALMLALVLAAGVVGTVWQAREARQQALLAQQQAQRAIAVRDFLADVFMSTDPSDGEIPDVLDLLDEGSRRARALTASDPLIAADILLISGSARNALSDLDGAESDLLLSLQLLEKIRPAPARALSRVHWDLGILYKMRGLQQKSLHHYREAVRWDKRWDAPAGERLAHEASLAGALSNSGLLAQSERVSRKVLAALPAAGLLDSQLHMDTLNALGTTLAALDAPLDELIDLHEQRLRLARKLYGETSGWYAYTLADSVPTLRQSPAHLDRAEQVARQAVAISARIYDEPHLIAAVAACNLAALLMQGERNAEALHYYDIALGIDEALDRNDLHAESCRYGRAKALLAKGNMADALVDLEKDRTMLLKLGRQRSAIWLRNCALEAGIVQQRQPGTRVDSLLKACERDHAPQGKPLPTSYLEARRRLGVAERP